MSASRVQGTVKWFSNSKGYGFITPSSSRDSDSDIFVHQSSIHSDGYRTLGDGWVVEFNLVTDETGKVKADNVTAPGGGPCTGPRKRPSSSRRGSKPESSSKKSDPKPKQPWWHAELAEPLKKGMVDKGIRMTTGTVDVSYEGYRIKLGTLDYTSMARSDGALAEGSFTTNFDNGVVSFEWQRAIKHDGIWKTHDINELIKTLTLSDEKVKRVEPDETALTLWGHEPQDTKEALERNGFQMRRVVLTPRTPKVTDQAEKK